MRCIIRFVRALVLLAILAEAYSFINPSSYVAAYSALSSHLDESLLSLILAASMAVIRIFFKALHFTFSVEFALLIWGGAWGTVEIDTQREWGMVYHLKFSRRGYAFRWALSRDCCVVRWFVWYYDVLNRVLDLLGEFAWSVAGQAE